MSNHLARTSETPAVPVPISDADATDEQLIALWLHERSRHTIRAYRRDVEHLCAFLSGKPLRAITLGDLQAFSDTLTGEGSSRGRVIASVKSLLSFGAKLGALPFNVGAALRKPAARDTLADRILTEDDTAKMLALTTGRNHVLIRLLYAGGFRVSEIVALRWADLADAPNGGMFVTVHGKGDKTRTVRISTKTASLVRALRVDAPASAFVFPGRARNGATSAVQAWRIVRTAARRAGIEKAVSPHFLRHSHASHAIERGAKVTCVRDTLGHSSIAVTDRYAHARPGESSGDVLAV
jgi:site-specific recombinase XerD